MNVKGTILETRSFQCDISVGDIAVGSLQAPTVNRDNDVVINCTILNSEAYRENREDCDKIIGEFYDAVYKAFDELNKTSEGA